MSESSLVSVTGVGRPFTGLTNNGSGYHFLHLYTQCFLLPLDLIFLPVLDAGLASSRCPFTDLRSDKLRC